VEPELELVASGNSQVGELLLRERDVGPDLATVRQIQDRLSRAKLENFAVDRVVVKNIDRHVAARVIELSAEQRRHRHGGKHEGRSSGSESDEKQQGQTGHPACSRP
jgi:hypothetical protein